VIAGPIDADAEPALGHTVKLSRVDGRGMPPNAGMETRPRQFALGSLVASECAPAARIRTPSSRCHVKSNNRSDGLHQVAPRTPTAMPVLGPTDADCGAHAHPPDAADPLDRTYVRSYH
jgi:hypothetical protein